MHRQHADLTSLDTLVTVTVAPIHSTVLIHSVLYQLTRVFKG